MIFKNTLFPRLIMLCALLFSFTALAQVNNDACNEVTKVYNNDGFVDDDFDRADGGILVGDSIRLDSDQPLDTENLLLGLDQPFYVDYLAEGAGANHLFGFFFMDIDTDKDGIPDFYETGPNDDLDGDGLANIDDTDDDNDGIPDTDDTRPSGVARSSPVELFRNGDVAAAAGEHPGDYWQFVPNSVRTEPGSYNGMFEHPGAYLYVDNEGAVGVPDMLEARDVVNNEGNIPPYVVQRDFNGTGLDGRAHPGFLGHFDYSGTPTGGSGTNLHWIGETIFYLADDDDDRGTTWQYQNYLPYDYNTYQDRYASTNSFIDYLLYGTSDINSPNIPDALKNSDGTARTAPNGHEYWRFRWYESNISGARELVFFLVVFYNGGYNTNEDNVNTYYSKSAFNPDPYDPGNADRSGNTSGDNFGGSGRDNWYPNFQDMGDHNRLTRAVFGAGTNWTDIATAPTDGSAPVAHNTDNQAWVDMYNNWQPDRRILQYRALRDWFSGTSVDANNIINGRYTIDMDAENDSSIIRAINGRMVHLMVGAPESSRDAWLLGWEDLYSGGDRDYEDVVFYVKRAAGGVLQSGNVAEDATELFDDFTITQVSFDFTDNFTDGNWGIEGRYINYYYRLASSDEWIPLLGSNTEGLEHTREVDLFQPVFGGETVETGGSVRRTLTLQIQVPATQVYWKVEMATNNVDLFSPVVEDAIVGYQTLTHDFFYNAAVIPSSNMRYIPSVETPAFSWEDNRRNRGHLYGQQWFEHGPTPTALPNTINPETTPESQPTDPYIHWDAGVTMLQNLGGSERVIYTAIPSNPSAEYATNLTRYQLERDRTDAEVVSAYQFIDVQSSGEWLYNFHDPAADDPDHQSAALWLQNWLHGYANATVTAGNLIDDGPTRDWILGGLNRGAVDVVRAPGIPAWINGNAVPASLKRSYFEFMTSSEQSGERTRLLIGSESGLVHCIDAGAWRPVLSDPNHAPADGHFAGDDYGTGAELWSFLPGHLLDDLKHNYVGNRSVTAKVDATIHSRIVYDGTDWRRIAIIVQGFKAGQEDMSGTDLTGNVVTALDVTNPDSEPIPLWHRREPNMQDIVMIPSIGWVELDDDTQVWAVAYSSGATPVTGQAPSFRLVNAVTGADLGVSSTVGNAGGDFVMLGSPAFLDTDDNGFIDHMVGATSEGLLWVRGTRGDGTPLTSVRVANARFFHTPNTRANGSMIEMYIASSDSPFLYDEDEYGGGDFVNNVYRYTFDITNGGFTETGFNPLPTNHKVFGRPALVGNRLIVGTATGDTYSLCDFDRTDPGNLLNFNAPALGADDALVEEIDDLAAPVVGAIIVHNGSVEVHVNQTDQTTGGGGAENHTVFNPDEPKPAPTQSMTGATVFGVLGWEDTMMSQITIQ
ncbi:DUF4114 domain-containing protein [Acanthopleuribacter pedis]|uniref:DUF4114 domain-containing protein n=1 Tax=Acanthopleuribacter pedis TaxID=442870 RepID=A0A8J7QB58_9BACT|nr:DUF4114 domain-containing protein [Acanthopleuribacter pedis]MBO1320859.1 DUF4114 domain-containing protein [Acanthopleuribacter pedis]